MSFLPGGGIFRSPFKPFLWRGKRQGFYNGPMHALTYTRAQQLPAILRERIAILDGAMGTMIQRFKLTEAQYRGCLLYTSRCV